MSAPVHVDFFLIGAPKAGTTSLATALANHPEMCVSNPKEPNLLANFRGTFTRYQESPDWLAYERCFLGQRGLRLDASVCVFADPEAPARYREWYPDAKFLLSVRDPVIRAVSHWAMISDSGEDLEHGADWRSFRHAWADERLVVHSLYGRNLERWLEHFPRERFLFLATEDMLARPREALRRIAEFCGIALDAFTECEFRHENAARARRAQARSWNKARLLFRRVAPTVRIPRVLSVPAWKAFERRGQTADVKPWQYELCESELLPDIQKFSELSGLDCEHLIARFPTKDRR
jgi:hypothetical protein